MPVESNCNVTALRRASRHLTKLYDAELAPSGLRATQRGILVQVARQGAPTMTELAAALVLDRTALNRNLKPMVEAGLLRVVADEEDRRSKRILLSARGEARIRETRELWRRAQDRFEAVYGAREAAALRSSLNAIASIEF
jgi:DNA-binding MarR family transcriptional regulator